MQRRLNLRNTGAPSANRLSSLKGVFANEIAAPNRTVVKEQRRFACPATAIWALVSKFSHLHSWHFAVLSTVYCTKVFASLHVGISHSFVVRLHVISDAL